MASLGEKTETTIEFPTIENGGVGLMVVVQSADNIWGEIQLDGHDPPCRKWRMPRDGGIHGLGRAVGIDTGFGREWQQRGHWCSCLCHFSIIHHVLGSRVDSQMDVIVATFVKCREADLALALPLVPYCPTAPSPACPPSTASMLYPLLYASVILGLSPPFPLSSLSLCSLSLSLLSWLLYIRALPVLADGT
ncbi:hypothetical protein ARMSODRAFT_982322 [Armillaria solidipes]|uniref:Uncharacterized protein n=1 Tax=Armillaria solidipes TaxID=1076256 RepID=A0A2H3B2Z6_9AGAR|nr:hypothetical protein ARMSODRAFT_982322 [Armillaria solidipes]